MVTHVLETRLFLGSLHIRVQIHHGLDLDFGTCAIQLCWSRLPIKLVAHFIDVSTNNAENDSDEREPGAAESRVPLENDFLGWMNFDESKSKQEVATCEMFMHQYGPFPGCVYELLKSKTIVVRCVLVPDDEYMGTEAKSKSKSSSVGTGATAALGIGVMRLDIALADYPICDGIVSEDLLVSCIARTSITNETFVWLHTVFFFWGGGGRFFGPVDVREACFGPCVVAAAYTVGID